MYFKYNNLPLGMFLISVICLGPQFTVLSLLIGCIIFWNWIWRNQGSCADCHLILSWEDDIAFNWGEWDLRVDLRTEILPLMVGKSDSAFGNAC